MPRTDAGKPSKKPRSTAPPPGDRPATRKQDLKKAERFKKTKTYKRAIKVAYKSQPVAKRQERVKHAESKPAAKRSTEDKAILDTHGKRSAREKRNRALQILTDRQRDMIDEFKRGPTYRKALQEARAARKERMERVDGIPGTEYAHDPHAERMKKDPLEKVIAGPAAGYKALAIPIGSMVSGAAVVEATARDPIGVPSKTAKQFLTSLPAIPGELVNAVKDPVGTAKETVEGMAERSTQPYDERVKTIKEEGGLLYAGDAAIVAGAGSAATKLLNPRRAARQGSRPDVRISGEAVKAAPNRGALGDAVGRAAQKRRAKKHEAALAEAEAGGKPVDVVVRQAAEANRRAGRVVETVGLNAGLRQGRLVAKQRGRGIYGLKRDQGRRTNADRKLINKLNAKEKRAFYYATVFGIRNAAQARELLPGLAKTIRDTRARDGVQVTGSLKKSDMLPDINAILNDPEGHFTAKLGETVEALRPDSIRAGREDPSLRTASQRMNRRFAPLAELLGMERGVLDGGNEWHYVPGEADFAEARARMKKDPEEEIIDAEVVGLPRPVAGLLTAGKPKPKAPPKTAWFAPKPGGEPGRGFIDDDGVLHTWSESEGAHLEVQRLRDKTSRGDLHIRPDGTVVAGGYARPSRKLLLDEYEAVARAVAQDSRLKPPKAWDLDARPHDGKREHPSFNEVLDRVRAEYADAPKERGDAPLPIPNQRHIPNLAAAVANVYRGEVGPRRERAGGGYYEERPAGLRYFDEGDAAFIKRILARADELGLEKPLYFKSERYAGQPDFGAYAAGGIRAMGNDPRYRGTNLRQGLQDTSPEQFVRGKARNIKRKHNWEMVADILQSNRVKEFGRSSGGTVSALREQLARKGVDFQSVGLWNPGVFREQVGQKVAMGDERFMNAEEFGEAKTAVALGRAVIRIDPESGRVIDGQGNAVPEEMLLKSRGWHVVPQTVLRELEAQMVPSNAYGRSWDIAKGKASRMMLLSGNLPWLGFQVASNTAMGTVATGGRLLNPANWMGAHKWWKELTPEEQQRVGGMLGLDATSADTQQVRLGATTNNDLVNSYRAFKAHPFWHTGVAKGRGPSVSAMNPFELMARADRGQNNVFRIVAGYSKAKREAVKRMGENMGRAERAQLKLTSIMAKPPREQLAALAKDKDLLEEHADAITDWMGDYTTLTASERKVVNRAVMFYPYMRYSLRLLFYTMPVKHPAVTALLAELGTMRMEELRELFGEDSLPWNSGKIYFGEGGDVTAIDLKRANPALSAPVDALRTGSPGGLLGVAPPMVSMLVNQLAGKELFFNRDYRVQGKAGQYGQEIPLGAVGVRARILANDITGLLFPSRLAGAMEYNPVKDGPIPFLDGGEDPRLSEAQGDDSLFFSPRPTRFKGDDDAAKMKNRAAEEAEAFEEDNESIINELMPLIPEPNRDAARAADDAKIKKAEKPKKKRKGGGGYFGSSRGSGYFGGD